MKNIKYLLAIALISIALLSCEKENDIIVDKFQSTEQPIGNLLIFSNEEVEQLIGNSSQDFETKFNLLSKHISLNYKDYYKVDESILKNSSRLTSAIQNVHCLAGTYDEDNGTWRVISNAGPANTKVISQDFLRLETSPHIVGASASIWVDRDGDFAFEELFKIQTDGPRSISCGSNDINAKGRSEWYYGSSNKLVVFVTCDY